jgi:hypothetical protein
MPFRASPSAIAAILFSATVCAATACPSDPEPAPAFAETTGGVSFEVEEKVSRGTQPETSRAAASQSFAVGLEAEFAIPNWMLLLDHEGESFTFYAGDNTSGIEELVGEPAWSFSSMPAGVPALGLVLDEDAAFILSQLYEAGPATTGSSFTVADGLARVGYEDQ